VHKKYQFVSEICHIEAASPGGQRYNSRQTDEQRRGYDNLVVAKMKEIKELHERKHEGSSFQVDESVLRGIAEDIQTYWDRIDRLNTLEHIAPPDVAIPIDSKATFDQILEYCRATVVWLCSRHDALRESNERLPDNFCRLL